MSNISNAVHLAVVAGFGMAAAAIARDYRNPDLARRLILGSGYRREHFALACLEPCDLAVIDEVLGIAPPAPAAADAKKVAAA